MPESKLPFFRSVGSQLVVHAQYHPRAGEGACRRYLTFFPPSTLCLPPPLSLLFLPRLGSLCPCLMHLPFDMSSLS